MAIVDGFITNDESGLIVALNDGNDAFYAVERFYKGGRTRMALFLDGALARGQAEFWSRVPSVTHVEVVRWVVDSRDTVSEG